MVHRINDPSEKPNDSAPERHPGDRDYFPLIPRSEAPRDVVLVVHANEELRHFDPDAITEFTHDSGWSVGLETNVLRTL